MMLPSDKNIIRCYEVMLKEKQLIKLEKFNQLVLKYKNRQKEVDYYMQLLEREIKEILGNKNDKRKRA